MGKINIAQDRAALLADVAQTETAPGKAAFWWLCQHTFIVKAGGKVFYLDPWFTHLDGRQTPTLLLPDDAHRPDFRSPRSPGATPSSSRLVRSISNA